MQLENEAVCSAPPFDARRITEILAEAGHLLQVVSFYAAQASIHILHLLVACFQKLIPTNRKKINFSKENF